jgi:hypothetical protein
VTGLRLTLAVLALFVVAACAGTATMAPPPAVLSDGWTTAEAATRPVGLGLPGGARLADGVRFAGGLQLVADAASPLHGLSDFKLIGDTGFVSVSDSGDLVRGRLTFDADGDLTGVAALRLRRLSRADGQAIADKADGDAEGLMLTADGDLMVSFERDHRIWRYGPVDQPRPRPAPVSRPDLAFAPNEGIEAISAAPGGWRVAGEGGGLWDCGPSGCRAVTAPPATPLADSEYRITGMDRDPSGAGFFVVQRSYSPPIDARARVRRMAADGALGPVLIELKLPGVTDNFEGIAAVVHGGVRLYILSDDNGNPAQRTLLLAFDVRSAPTP